jgi:hypothetical protein
VHLDNFFGTASGLGYLAYRKRSGVCGKNNVASGQIVQLGEYFSFDLDLLENALDYKIALPRRSEVACQGYAGQNGGFFGFSHFALIDSFLQALFYAGFGVFAKIEAYIAQHRFETLLGTQLSNPRSHVSSAYDKNFLNSHPYLLEL